MKHREFKKLYLKYKQLKEVAGADGVSSVAVENPLGTTNVVLAQQCSVVTDFSDWQEHSDDQAADLFECISFWYENLYTQTLTVVKAPSRGHKHWQADQKEDQRGWRLQHHQPGHCQRHSGRGKQLGRHHHEATVATRPGSLRN